MAHKLCRTFAPPPPPTTTTTTTTPAVGARSNHLLFPSGNKAASERGKGARGVRCHTRLSALSFLLKFLFPLLIFVVTYDYTRLTIRPSPTTHACRTAP